MAFDVLQLGPQTGSVHKYPCHPSKQVHVFSIPLQSPFIHPDGLIHWLQVGPVQALLQTHFPGSAQIPLTHSSVQMARKK